MAESERHEFADAFIEPVEVTWKNQLGRELREVADQGDLLPSGPMVGVRVSVRGTAQGYVLYYFGAETASRAAGEFGSKPLVPGGDASLGAARDLVGVVSSNARVLMQQSYQAIEIKTDEVFSCRESGLTGDEEWTGSVHLRTPGDATSIFGVDDVYVFVYIAAMSDRSAPPVPDVRGIVSRARASADAGVRSRPRSSSGAAPPLPVPGVDKPTVIEEARCEVMKARRVFVVDGEGRRRIAISAREDGSTSVIFADEQGRMRATVALSNKGVGRAMFIDRYGRRTFVAPPSIKASRSVRDRARRLAERRFRSLEQVAVRDGSEERALIDALADTNSGEA